MTAAADSPWTSHRAYIGLDEPPQWLDIETGLRICGFDSSKTGRRLFDEFVRSRTGDIRDSLFEGDIIDTLRNQVRQVMRAPVELGSQQVKRDGRSTTAIYSRTSSPGQTISRPTLEAIREACADEIDLSVQQIRSRRRNRLLSDGRRLVLYVAHRRFDYSLTQVAAALKIGGPTSHELILDRKITSRHIQLASRVCSRFANHFLP